MKKLTKNELEKNLIILKTTLKDFDKKNFYNISFINTDALYSHLENNNQSSTSIKLIMKNIEQYLPLKIFADVEVLDLFEYTICSDNPQEINSLKNIFYKKAVIRFLYLISGVETKEQWNEIVTACEQMRKMI